MSNLFFNWSSELREPTMGGFSSCLLMIALFWIACFIDGDEGDHSRDVRIPNLRTVIQDQNYRRK